MLELLNQGTAKWLRNKVVRLAYALLVCDPDELRLFEDSSRLLPRKLCKAPLRSLFLLCNSLDKAITPFLLQFLCSLTILFTLELLELELLLHFGVETLSRAGPSIDRLGTSAEQIQVASGLFEHVWVDASFLGISHQPVFYHGLLVC